MTMSNTSCSGSNPQPQDVAKEMLLRLDLELISCVEIQTLWAGYGHICEVKARRTTQLGSAAIPEIESHGGVIDLILKIVSPPSGRGDEGHLRKIFSYEVEQYFYDEVAPTLQRVPLAKCLSSTSGNRNLAVAAGLANVNATLMSDLRQKYPVAGEKRAVLTRQQVHSALRWLANFHGSYWNAPAKSLDGFILPPLQENTLRQGKQGTARKGLWLNGGYTYLATRGSEYRSLLQDHDSEWPSLLCQPVPNSALSTTELAAEFLTPRGRPFETYIHGDVKSENMFSTETGDEVALFDFQYVGLGLGVCDLAKLFTCSVPMDMLLGSGQLHSQLVMSDGERALLEEYRKHLLSREGGAATPSYDWGTFKRHWETALVDWCRFQASWGFWGNTEWLQARVRSIVCDEQWVNWLRRDVDELGE
ncbi:hypothetical protein QQS21_004185 [Conoideocrella luteorostrata]|uniref:Aminoglycoside phosphotransferase domain-containing protein n=1 Tax=Conoideocrella luteorostrata TaxID=1105319 RepID=A0AAJ0CVZ1_9HYPO|nr:hypothetical protein QQS21_004185 [Conoideocrella luteorostrata]